MDEEGTLEGSRRRIVDTTDVQLSHFVFQISSDLDLIGGPFHPISNETKRRGRKCRRSSLIRDFQFDFSNGDGTRRRRMERKPMDEGNIRGRDLIQEDIGFALKKEVGIGKNMER